MVAPRTILVTGASGFIGLHLVRRLLAQGDSVRTLCRGRSSQLEQLQPAQNPQNLLTMQGDLLALSDAELDQMLQGIDVVYHLAGLVSYQRRDIARQRLVNVEGTRRIAAAALRSAGQRKIRLIHTSSIAGMGVPRARWRGRR